MQRAPVPCRLIPIVLTVSCCRNQESEVGKGMGIFTREGDLSVFCPLSRFFAWLEILCDGNTGGDDGIGSIPEVVGGGLVHDKPIQPGQEAVKESRAGNK